MSINKRYFTQAICPLLLLGLAWFSLPAQADSSERPSRADSHAPIGVMGDHTHDRGEYMLAYRYKHMNMQGSRIGQTDISTADVLRNHMSAPLEMDMDMHMFGMMYGLNNTVTLTAMVPYIEKDMLSETRMGGQRSTSTSGIGDIKISSLWRLYRHYTADEAQNMIFGLGFSLPTGSIDEQSNTPAGGQRRLPFPMQLGSGTVDPILNLTYFREYAKWSWGTQFGAVLRFGRNDEGYRLGNTYHGTGWVARLLHPNASLSLRLHGTQQHNIKGRDSSLESMLLPTASTDLLERGGKRIEILVGLNLYQTKGRLSGHRVALEVGTPVYQNLNGPQLKRDYNLTLGWQWSF